MPAKKSDTITKEKPVPKSVKEKGKGSRLQDKMEFEYFLQSYCEIQKENYLKEEKELVAAKELFRTRTNNGHYLQGGGGYGGRKIEDLGKIDSWTNQIIRTSEKIINFIQSDSLSRIAKSLETIEKGME